MGRSIGVRESGGDARGVHFQIEIPLYMRVLLPQDLHRKAQGRRVGTHDVAFATQVVVTCVVCVEISRSVEMLLAPLAIRMPRILDVVLLQRICAHEIQVALVTDVVHVGIVFVLFQRAVGIEPSVAAVAEGHSVRG